MSPSLFCCQLLVCEPIIILSVLCVIFLVVSLYNGCNWLSDLLFFVARLSPVKHIRFDKIKVIQVTECFKLCSLEVLAHAVEILFDPSCRSAQVSQSNHSSITDDSGDRIVGRISKSHVPELFFKQAAKALNHRHALFDVIAGVLG